MSDPRDLLIKLIEHDKRYKLEAYAFIFEALQFAQENLKMGSEITPDDIEGSTANPSVKTKGSKGSIPKSKKSKDRIAGEDVAPERHLTGQELCEAIRVYASEQYGYLAKCVLNSWGLKSTSDFGEIVFNLIEIQHMRKTKHDRREHFDNVYDFEEAFVRDFKITKK